MNITESQAWYNYVLLSILWGYDFMLLSHISIALELIAIGVGASLLVWSLRTKGAGIALAKALGIIIIVLASFDLLCTVYSTYLYRNFAYYHQGQPSATKPSDATCPMCAEMKKNQNKQEAGKMH